jgi:hypothetical protein
VAASVATVTAKVIAEWRKTAQTAIVKTQHRSKNALARLEDRPALAGPVTSNQPCAHRRRDRQRDQSRHYDSGTHSHCEFAEQAADYPAHEQHGDEHRD